MKHIFSEPFHSTHSIASVPSVFVSLAPHILLMQQRHQKHTHFNGEIFQHEEIENDVKIMIHTFKFCKGKEKPKNGYIFFS